MQRKHGAGDAIRVSPLEGAMFESWFEGGMEQTTGMGKPWPVAAQSGNAGGLLGQAKQGCSEEEAVANKSWRSRRRSR